MFKFIIAFLSGDLYLQQFAQLPTTNFILTLFFFSLIFFGIFRKYKAFNFLPIAFTLGFAFSVIYANNILSWSLAKNIESKNVIATGYIASLPIVEETGIKFFFSLAELHGASLPKSSLIKLSYNALDKPFKPGDKWQFLVRLKRIHGNQSPGAFDFEAWALQKGLRASGYIVASDKNILLAHAWYHYPIDQLRQRLLQHIQQVLPLSTTSHWLLALIVGERIGITASEWQVLRNTGTNHLMAIAGLHIGIIVAITHFLIRRMWKFFPRLGLLIPSMLASCCGALLVACCYSLLAGFSIPTQRACIMLALYIIVALLRKKPDALTVWACALFIVLLMNPLSVLTQSFWLSFATIALIMYGMQGRINPNGWWWKWGRVQWVIGIGLIPLSLALFQECSLISFLANSIAIPWLGLTILPLCFLSAIFIFIFPALSGYCLSLADKLFAGLWTLLTWFAQLHFSSLQLAVPNWEIFIISLLGCLFLLTPKGFPTKWVAILWLAPLFLYQPPKLNNGEINLSLLDVGQGLSVVLQTKSHILIYDTGPKFSDNFDMGENIVLPYLRMLRVPTINMLIISHGDNDHLGGASAINKAISIQSIVTSVPEKVRANLLSAENFKPINITTCIAGKKWQWDQVNFEFLYPSEENLDLNNDSSCVLKISTNKQEILLTGDIEKYAERELLSINPSALKANLLVAPHHGSKTSGMHAFIQAVHPELVLYSTGYLNRYRFPHQSVVKAYTAINAKQWNSAETGTVRIKWNNKKEESLKIESQRYTYRRYWMEG